MSASPAASATILPRVSTPLLDTVFLVGLAGVFIVNAVIALLEPQGFVELVASGPMGGLATGPAEPLIGPGIAVNDFSIGLALLATQRYRGLRAGVLAWAGLWLMVVTVMKLAAI